MFEITIKGDTLEELAGNVQRIASMCQTVPAGGEAKPSRSKAKAKPEPEPETEEIDEEDAKLEAELNAPAEPMPETAKQVVDAGTGQPVAADKTIKMTMDDVKAAAAQLAAKDTPKLAELLKKYDAAKLSEVPKGKLADFAADVMEALG